MGIDVMETVKVGDKEFQYVSSYDNRNNCKVVKLYDGGEYVTEFPTVDDMTEYLRHDVPEVIIEEIECLKRFREKCKVLLKTDYNYMGGKIEEKEKSRNHEAFVKRINILKGNLSNPEFGRIVGMNQCTLYNLVVGSRGPGQHILKRISEQCGVSVDWLLGGK